jgi:mannosyltransferase OCH1-like enzyme
MSLHTVFPAENIALKTLPRFIHQTWKHSHLRWPLSACVQSFQKWNPHWRHVMWTDADCENLIRERLPEFLPFYLSYPPGILRADIFRVVVLYIEGGVYADLDMECLRSLDELIAACGDNEWEMLLARDHPCHERTHYKGRAMWLNAFMIAKPGAKFLRYVLDAIMRQANTTYDKTDPVQVTGPGLLTRIVHLGDNNLADIGIREIPWQWVHPLPHIFVHFKERARYKRLILTREWREGKQVRLLESGDDFLPWGVPPFAAHYWWHSYISNHREVNMLSKYAHSLLQSDGEIVERRLNELPEMVQDSCLQSVGEALCLMAERGGNIVVIAGDAHNQDLGKLVLSTGRGLGWNVLADNGQAKADLIMYAGNASEINARWATVAQRLNRRGLFAIVSGDHESSGYASEKIANMRRLDGPSQIWEIKPMITEEVPKLIHLFSDSNTRGSATFQRSWLRTHPHPWRVKLWNLDKLKDWIEQQVPNFAATYWGYPSDECRLLAGRLLVLAKLGGVAVLPGIVAIRSLEELLIWKRLVFDVKHEVSGPLASDRVIASCVGHPFWNGLVEALDLMRHKPTEEAVGALFLAQRVKAFIQFASKQDWPTLIDPDVLVCNPGSTEWCRLVVSEMWTALCTLYPNAYSLVAPK